MSVKHPAQFALMALMVIALSSTAIAQGNGNGNGNGNGGGGGGGGNDPPPKYSVVELAGMYHPSDMSDPPNGQSDLWVAGRSRDPATSFSKAMYARITHTDGDVTVGFLPEVDPQGSFDGHSWAYAVNNAGDIAGEAQVLDTSSEDVFDHAVVWIRNPEDNSFTFNDLDQNFEFEHSVAKDLNNHGIAVGVARLGGGGVLHARIWDLTTGSSSSYDLNDFLPTGSPWFLTEATQVNDSGMIGGEGLLGGDRRGFVLTLATDPQTNQTLATVTAVPLLTGGGPQIYEVRALTEDGQMTGEADAIWDEPSDRYIRHAYYWNGTSSSSVDLGTLTGDDSTGSGINIWGEVVGESDIPPEIDPNLATATYWGTDNLPVSLESEIPSRPKWTLTYAADINDDGCVLANGGKSYRGDVIWMGVILVPDAP